MQSSYLRRLVVTMFLIALSGCAHCSSFEIVGSNGETVVRAQDSIPAPDAPPGAGHTVFWPSQQPYWPARGANPAAEPAAAPTSLTGLHPAVAPTNNLQPPALQPIRLREAIALGLGQSEVIRTLGGIERVTPYDPLVADAEASAEIGVFAPELRFSYEGGQIDGPPESFFGPGISTATRYDEGDVITELRKRWPLGTTTRIAHDPTSLGYLYFPSSDDPDTFNPAYSSAGVFEIRQPLLRGFGFDVNTAPIRIAQARREQSHWEVEEVTLRQVRSIEESYWQLYAAHVAWQSVQSVIPIAQEAVRIEQLRFEAERSTYADVARTKVQLERLRQQATRARQRAVESENQLRQLIGFDAVAGPPLIPVDTPPEQEVAIDMAEAVGVAIDRRPDLHRRRFEVERLDWQRLVAQNDTLPQVDARYQYRTNGLANRLDDAFQQAATFDYSDWTIGVEVSIPLGNRRARSQLLARERELARERALLREFERQVAYDVSVIAAESQSRWEQAGSALREVAEAERWLKLATIRYTHPTAQDTSRNVLLAALDDFQTAMQAYVNARSGAAEVLAEYGIALARFEEAQGTLLDRWQIEFASMESQHETFDTPSAPPALDPTTPFFTAAPSPTSETGQHAIAPSSVAENASNLHETHTVLRPFTNVRPWIGTHSAGFPPAQPDYHQNSVRR